MKCDVPDPVTVTHARLRARQGDRRGAERILRARLQRVPGDPEALDLLRTIGTVPDLAPVEECPGEPEPRTPSSAAALAARFRRELSSRASNAARIRKLQGWLRRIQRT